MKLVPTNNGGRRIEFNTPFGAGHAEWDADGNLVSESMTPGSDPLGPPASDAEAGFSKDVGDHLRDVIDESASLNHNDTGSCGSCNALRRKMNEGGPQWCRENIGWLTHQLMGNAKENRGWIGWAARLGFGYNKAQQMIEAAIERTENQIGQ